MVQELKFYDVKSKKSFNSSKYRIVVKSGRRFAVSTSPYTKIECYRIVGKG